MKGVFEFSYPGPLAWTLPSEDPDRCQICGEGIGSRKKFQMSREIERQLYEIVYHLDCAKPYLKLKGPKISRLQPIEPCCRKLFKQMMAQNMANTSSICDGCGVFWIQHPGGRQ